MRKLQSRYQSLDSRWGGSEHEQAEAMVMSLIEEGVPDAQIRAIFGIGGTKLGRLKHLSKNGHIVQVAQLPSHAYSDDDVEFFY
jgi:hypothetical protein